MNIICLSILASTILLCDEIINGKLKVSKRLFNWIEKIGDRVSGTEFYRSEKEGNTTAKSE
ncbi:MAG: hypothetical protein QNJ74_08200 [Trichodesmium sp. MO_231.B1]|nr:hypothetical protein [Trichodesmium sp. MO_231.B1]